VVDVAVDVAVDLVDAEEVVVVDLVVDLVAVSQLGKVGKCENHYLYIYYIILKM
jgi:hypothetical protein